MGDNISSNSTDFINKLKMAQYKKTEQTEESKKQEKINSIIANFNKRHGNTNNISSQSSVPQTHINADGSGTKVTQKRDKNGNITTEVVKLGAGGRVLSKTSNVENKDGKTIQISSTKYSYDKDGKLKKTKLIKTNQQGKLVQENLYGSDGKIQHQTKEFSSVKNGKKLKSKAETDFYYNNGKLTSSIKKGIDTSGKPYEEKNNYEADGKTLKNRETSYYKRGALHKDYYDGANLKNRINGGLPNTRVVYEEDGKTVKETIKNEFDTNGVLIGREKYDRNGKLIEKHDFSKVDGYFDTAYQIGKGDCYLLASINALSQTEAGQEMLRQNIKESVNEKGEKVYTITFPGAEIARETLINGTGDVNIGKFPEDKVHIQGSYTVTEAELQAASLRAGKDYSAGDKDVLLYEIAYEKYRNDVAQTIKDNNIDPRKTQYIAGLGIANVSSNDKLSGGNTAEATYILTGEKSDLYLNPQKAPICYIDSDMNMHLVDSFGNIDTDMKATAVTVNNNRNSDVDEMLENLQEDSRDGKIDNYAATASFVVSTQEVNGQAILGGGHALTIVKVTEDEVVLSNPWDPDTNIVMSKEEFKKAASKVSYIELDSAQSSQNNPTYDNNLESILRNLQSLISQQNPSGTALSAEQRENIISAIREQLTQQNLSPSKDNLQGILNRLKQQYPDL